MGTQTVAALIEQAEAVSHAIKTRSNGHSVTDVTDVTVPMGDEGKALPSSPKGTVTSVTSVTEWPLRSVLMAVDTDSARAISAATL